MERTWWRRTLVVMALVGLWMGACCLPAGAESVLETWRNPFGIARAVDVNPLDGTMWVAAGNSVLHLSAAGDVLLAKSGFADPLAIRLDAVRGVVWVAEGRFGKVYRLSAAGKVLSVTSGFITPFSLALNPLDGSLWVGDRGYYDYGIQAYVEAKLTHLAGNGSELWTQDQIEGVQAVAIDPQNGSVWLVHFGHYDWGTGEYVGDDLVHLSPAGAELWRTTQWDGVNNVAVHPTDSTIWLTCYDGLVHATPTGTELSDLDYYTGGCLVAEEDGSCWMGMGGDMATYTDYVLHVAANGSTLLAEIYPHGGELSMAALADGGCVIANEDALLGYSATGALLWTIPCERNFDSVVVDVNDASVWFGAKEQENFTEFTGKLVHLDADGNELSRRTDLLGPISLGVDPNDSSLWAGVTGYHHHGMIIVGGQVAHLSSDTTTTIWDDPTLQDGARWLSVNAEDGSCWYAFGSGFGGGGYPDTIVHVNAAGVELWSSQSFGVVTALAVDPRDSACWVSHQGDWDPVSYSYGPAEVMKLSSEGTELFTLTTFTHPTALAVDPTDGACWVTDAGTFTPYNPSPTMDGAVVKLSPDGVELLRAAGFTAPTAISLNTTDGSVWVTERGYWAAGAPEIIEPSLYHLAADGAVLSQTHNLSNPKAVAVDPNDGSCWLVDGSQMAHLVLQPSIGVQSLSVTAGTTAQVPVILDLCGGQVDRVGFTFTIATDPTTPRPVGHLSFTTAGDLPAPTNTSHTVNRITVRWTRPLSPVLTGRVLLGYVNVGLSASTPVGTEYHLTVIPTNCSLNGQKMALCTEPIAVLMVE